VVLVRAVKKAFSVLRGREILIILALAFFLRVYHIDYPFAGHFAHKEVMHAGEAELLIRDGDFVNMKNYWLEPASGQYGEFTTYITYIMFRIFGVHEWAARLPALLSGIAAVYLLYLILIGLYGRKEALLGAFLFAITPMEVYFSRIVLEDAYQIPLILLSVFYFLRWSRDEKTKNLLWTAGSLALAIHVKITSLYIIGVFLLYLYTTKKRLLKEFNVLAAFAAALLAPFLWKLLLFGNFRIPPHTQGTDYLILLQWSYYKSMMLVWAGYITPLILFLFALGLYKVSGELRKHMFVVLWLMGSLAFLLVSVPFSFIHAYYSLAAVPAVCSIASLSAGSRYFKRPILAAVILLLSTIPSTYVIYSIQYPYVEVGEYIQNATNASEYSVMEPPSSYYAKRNSVGYASSLAELESLEKEYNLSYITIPGHVEQLYLKPDMKEHIEKNYHLEKVIYGRPNIIRYRLNMDREKSRYGYLSSLNSEPETVKIFKRNR